MRDTILKMLYIECPETYMHKNKVKSKEEQVKDE